MPTLGEWLTKHEARLACMGRARTGHGQGMGRARTGHGQGMGRARAGHGQGMGRAPVHLQCVCDVDRSERPAQCAVTCACAYCMCVHMPHRCANEATCSSRGAADAATCAHGTVRAERDLGPGQGSTNCSRPRGARCHQLPPPSVELGEQGEHGYSPREQGEPIVVRCSCGVRPKRYTCS